MSLLEFFSLYVIISEKLFLEFSSSSKKKKSIVYASQRMSIDLKLKV